jgi:glycosidase
LTEGDSFQPSPALQVLCDVYKYWIAYTDIDGFDVDMIKFIGDGPTHYFAQSVRSYAAQVGKDNFLVSGRLTGNVAVTSAIRRYGLSACSGVPHIQKKLWTVPKGVENPSEYFDLISHPVARNGTQHPGLLVKMLDDMHQTWRSADRRARYCSDNIGIRTIRCAIAFCLCTSGIPGIYYGTEQEFDGSGGSHRYIRESMFGGGFGAFGSRDRHFFDRSNPIYVAVSKLCRFRSQSLILRRGRQYLRQISGDGVDFGYPKRLGNERMRSIIAWSRILDNEELICVISTDDEATQKAWVTIDTEIHQLSLSVECVCSSDESLEGKRFPIEDRNGMAVRLTADPGHYAIYQDSLRSRTR